MSQENYIGMDVHQATISAAVMDAQGKLILECLWETKAVTIVDFVRGLHGPLSLTSEEGTSAAWLHDLLQPHVSRCAPLCAPLSHFLNVYLIIMKSQFQRQLQLSHRPRNHRSEIECS